MFLAVSPVKTNDPLPKLLAPMNSLETLMEIV